jgi:hypothetical protein
MVAPSGFHEQFIIDWVRKKLGDPTVQVELDETQIKQCIDDVMELFQKYKPKEQYVSQPYARGHFLIDPPEDAIGVLDVEFSRKDYSSYEDIEGALLYDPFYFLSAGGLSGVDVQTYDLIRHWTEIISREFGSEEGSILLDDGRLFIQLPGQFLVSIKWAMPLDSLNDIHRPYQQLFLNLVLAKSRQILGHIRGKYAQGVPGAGGMVQMDGEYQREKGAADEEKFTDELMRISPHFLPTMG